MIIIIIIIEIIIRDHLKACSSCNLDIITLGTLIISVKKSWTYIASAIEYDWHISNNEYSSFSYISTISTSANNKLHLIHGTCLCVSRYSQYGSNKYLLAIVYTSRYSRYRLKLRILYFGTNFTIFLSATFNHILISFWFHVDSGFWSAFGTACQSKEKEERDWQSWRNDSP